ncbi:TrbC/VIRB2 family protein [Candidatus Burarchaeum australiense]|nr:TrbC/VIRB2 family protein [Candidatus Burarchaeum australiense]
MTGARKIALLAPLMLIALAGLARAQGLEIPVDQPICRLYGILQVLGTIAGVLIAAYAGFVLASSNDIAERNSSKQLLGGVIIGLIIIWIAPLLVKSLVGATDVCGW